MSIKWGVENVTVEHPCPTELPVVEASIRGYVDSSRDVNPYSLAGLGRMVESKLNDAPAYSEARAKYEEASAKYEEFIRRHTIKKMVYANPFAIKNVIFNEPATIVFWADGTKTVVKCQEGDVFDPEKGLAMAFMKKVLGNKGNYFNEIKKWVPEEYYEDVEPIYPKIDIPEKLKNLGTSLEEYMARRIESVKKKDKPEDPCVGCDRGWGGSDGRSCYDECEVRKDYIKSLKEDK